MLSDYQRLKEKKSNSRGSGEITADSFKALLKARVSSEGEGTGDSGAGHRPPLRDARQAHASFRVAL